MEIHDYYKQLSELLLQRIPFWQVIIVAVEGSTPAKPGMKMLIPLAGSVHGNLGGGELEHRVIDWIQATHPEKPLMQTYLLSESGNQAGLETDITTSMICGGKVTLYIEPLGSSQTLYIIGAGHCGRALAQLAGLCGIHARLIDNRPEILSAIPTDICTDLQLSDYIDLEALIRFDAQALVVIMTHGHIHDQHVLSKCLGKPCKYLGMIGSAKKVAATLQALQEKGFSQDDLNRVHAPIGLPIGSQTPYEIAVSIMAQIIQQNSVSNRS